MRRVLRDNALSIVMFGLFVVFWGGQSVAGWKQHNEDQREHGLSAVGWSDYLRSGAFLESTFENWESEFLQMAAFIMLSAVLIQRGSAESKDPDSARDDADPPVNTTPEAPAPVHRGGLILKLYSHSLGIALGSLFVLSFALHAVTGVANYNEEAGAHGQPTITIVAYVASATFWFESFQNWQSEFLSVGVLVVLSIFLRQKGSPESKPVHASHATTGV